MHSGLWLKFLRGIPLLGLAESTRNHQNRPKSLRNRSESAKNDQKPPKSLRISRNQSKSIQIDQNRSKLVPSWAPPRPFSLKILRKNNVFLKFTIFSYDVILAPRLDLLGTSWCHLWSLMEPYEAILGLSWAPLVPSWSLLGPSWDVLEPPSGPLGVFWRPSWDLWGHLEPTRSPFWVDFGSVLGPFWTHFLTF